jgi:hypothetical protein
MLNEFEVRLFGEIVDGTDTSVGRLAGFVGAGGGGGDRWAIVASTQLVDIPFRDWRLDFRVLERW